MFPEFARPFDAVGLGARVTLIVVPAFVAFCFWSTNVNVAVNGSVPNVLSVLASRLKLTCVSVGIAVGATSGPTLHVNFRRRASAGL